MTVQLSIDEARRYLLTQTGLSRWRRGEEGIREMLASLRCVQLDPLDAIGTNADLVALARVDRIRKGDVYRASLPGHAFEHFAKERCLLPASAFPYYRERSVETPWWRLTERYHRVPSNVITKVIDELRERGPCTADDLFDHGSVEPLEWSGWKGTGRMTTMALEILWTRCEVVVAGRTASGGKIYDVPERALPAVHDARPSEPFDRWAILERVEAAGLLARAGGPCWSMLGEARTTMAQALIDEGAIEEVIVEGGSRPYLAPAGFRERKLGRLDGRMRILGPLDPLLWDRKLVKQCFAFDYVWEVYKPESERRWGWYVCPLLHRGWLVGRIEARVREGVLTVSRLWREEGRELDEDALREALERHARACGATDVALLAR